MVRRGEAEIPGVLPYIVSESLLLGAAPPSFKTLLVATWAVSCPAPHLKAYIPNTRTLLRPPPPGETSILTPIRSAGRARGKLFLPSYLPSGSLN